MKTEGLVKQGGAVMPKFIYHTWLVVGACVILLACAASRHDHHHHAGIGFEMLLVSYIGAIIIGAVYQKLRRGQLYDRRVSATKIWNRLIWGGVPAVFILCCLIGFAAGVAVALASAVYLVVMIIEIIVAQTRLAPIHKEPSDEPAEDGLTTTEDIGDCG